MYFVFRDGFGLSTYCLSHGRNQAITVRVRISAMAHFPENQEEWKNNKANGKGKFYHSDGDFYEG